MKKLIIIILLLLCLTANVSHSQSFKMFGQLPSGQFAEGLVFYWRGIEAVEVVDESYYDNHGTITGPTWVGNALDFDGDDDYVDLGIIGDWTAKEVTASVWVKFDNLTAQQNIVSKAQSNTAWDFAFDIGRTDRRITVIWRNDLILTSDTDLDLDTWYHITVVRSGVTGDWAAKVYVDGMLHGSTTTALNPTGGNSNVLLGIFRLGSLVWDFNGQIKQVIIHNRALSASEIAALYINPNLPMRQPPIWLLQPSVVPSGIIPIIQAHNRRRAG